MPLFVIQEELDNLDIDAIILPDCKKLKKYYQTSFYHEQNLYELFLSLKIENIKNILNNQIEQFQAVKNDFMKLLYNSDKDLYTKQEYLLILQPNFKKFWIKFLFLDSLFTKRYILNST